MLNKSTLFAIVLLVAGLNVQAEPQQAPQKDVGFAEYYLKEFEAEVKRAKGSANTMYRNKNEALNRIQKLMQAYPDDPAVQALYERTRTALMMSKGNYMPITPAMVAYLNHEKDLREKYAKLSQTKWAELQQGREMLTQVFPTADPLKTTADSSPIDKTVVLHGALYPDNQFVGATGEYIAVGKPSTGFYFVNIGGREWLGPYEGIKRFRREVDGSLGESLNFSILGTVQGPVMEIPGNRRVSMAWGWIVEPEALYIDGRIVATFDANHDKGGFYVEEDKVAAIKEGRYTEKSVPEDATPERVMEIFLSPLRRRTTSSTSNALTPSAARRRPGSHYCATTGTCTKSVCTASMCTHIQRYQDYRS